MGSARTNFVPYEEQAATGTDNLSARPRDLRQEAADRIAAHRQRRAGFGTGPRQPAPVEEPGIHPHNPIAAAVAERFAHSPSYRAVLAEQAQRAIEQAAAEAEIAARNAHAVAEAQNKLLAELDRWDAPQQFTPQTAQTIQRVETAAPVPVPVREISSAGLTVRLYEDIGAPALAPTLPVSPPAARDLDEARALDELDDEIAFRQAPVFEPYDIHPTPIPANLLEFPRQLVAPRKARPRLAEGPLLDDAPRSPQLRIFEVEPEQIAAAPPATANTPGWTGIHLDAQPETLPAQSSDQTTGHATDPANPIPTVIETRNLPLAPSDRPIQNAPLELRAMAAALDLTLVGFAFLVAVGVTAHFIHRIPAGAPTATAAAVTFALFWPLYELLFFTFSDQTPGMRYARISLCTFSDENPTRSAIRRRVLAQLVAVIPFGIGILWSLLDDDGLGWHDRISRMYQRSY